MAIREPSEGKGRYELISPYALQRLARHYENGARKYTVEKDIPKESIVDEIHAEIRKLVLRKYGTREDADAPFVTVSSEDSLLVTTPFLCRVYIGRNNESNYSNLIDDCHAEDISFPIFHKQENGKTKFFRVDDGGRNWEKGIPFSRYSDSAFRHLQQFMMGKTDEDHLAAAAWNIFAIMHHQEVGDNHLDDLPHYEDRKEH